jgi:hypothetical protein
VGAPHLSAPLHAPISSHVDELLLSAGAPTPYDLRDALAHVHERGLRTDMGDVLSSGQGEAVSMTVAVDTAS